MLYKFDAFLSHSSADKKLATDVARRLRARGYEVWFDKDHIRAGTSVPKEIRNGLAQSRLLLWCHTQQSRDSEWVLAEFEAMRYDEIISGVVRTIILVFDDTPLPFDVRQKRFVDFRSNRRVAWKELLEALYEDASLTIAACISNLNSASSVSESVDKLMKIALRRNDIASVAALQTAMELNAQNHDIVDAVANCLGQIVCQTQDSGLTQELKLVMASLAESKSDLVLDKMAYTCGQVAKLARSLDVREWAEAVIRTKSNAQNPDVARRFLYTARRIRLKVGE